jgi:hypothetical protein
LLAVGCGAESYEGATSSAPSRADVEETATGDAGAANQVDPSTLAPGAAPLERKIIYTANIDLVVEHFSPIPGQVEALAKQFDGYIGRSNISGSPDSPRRGQWTLRVPVERYEAFLQAAQKLGEVRSRSSNSQDVSEEFYDIDARIRNKRQEEDRLLKLMADATGKLEEILSVERELSRVRGEIEQMQGRLRVLTDLTSLTTIELRVEEIKSYVPPEAPTYTTRVRRSFNESMATLISTAENLSIAVIVVLPWLAVPLVPLLIVRASVNRKRRSPSLQAPPR